MSDKQEFLPGEDQCLAYLFSSQLRFLWAATYGADASIAINEAEEDIGEVFSNLLKTLSFIPGMPSPKNIIDAAKEKKFSLQKGSIFGALFDQNKFSFLDTWDEIKPVLIQSLNGKKDLATFFGHGCVISFDPEIVTKTLSQREDKNVAQQLGFEMWESLYDKAIKPFYKMPGTADDLIRYEE